MDLARSSGEKFAEKFAGYVKGIVEACVVDVLRVNLEGGEHVFGHIY